MSKKLLKFIENQMSQSPQLVKQFGDKIKDEAKRYYDSIISDDDSDIDPAPLVVSFFNSHKNAIHKEFEPHFKGQFSNVIGREAAKRLGIDITEVQGENGNIMLDKLYEKAEALIESAKKTGGTGGESEQLKALQQQISDIQSKYNTDKSVWEKAAKDAESKANSYIEKSELTKAFNELVRKAYDGATLREGISIETLADDYQTHAEKAGIIYRMVNGKVEARQKDNPDLPFLVDGVNNLDPLKHIRSVMDTKYTPVQIAGKSFGQQQQAAGGGEAPDPTKDIGAAMDNLMAETFGSEVK